MEAVNKTYFAGEYDWTVGYNGGRSSSTPDALAEFFKEIEKSPVAGGDAFWSLFGHNAPDCKVGVFTGTSVTNVRERGANTSEQHFVNHTDGYTLQYGNPANSAQINNRIQLVRKHFVKMSTGQDISAGTALKSVECPTSDAMWKRRVLEK